MEHLNRKHPKVIIDEYCIDEKDEYCIRLAALCHDLGMYFISFLYNIPKTIHSLFNNSLFINSGHGPFSHAFTDVAKKMLKADDDEFKVIMINDHSRT